MNRVLTKDVVRLQGLLHFSESFFARRQRKVLASFSIRPSQETVKGVKWCLCSRQSSRCFFFFSDSSLLRALEGLRSLNDVWLTSDALTSTMQSAPLSQKSQIKMLP